MKVYLSHKFKTEQEVLKIIKNKISIGLTELQVQENYVNIDFSLHNDTGWYITSIQEIEILKTFPDTNFLYITIQDSKSKYPPEIIDVENYGKIIEQVNNENLNLLNECYVLDRDHAPFKYLLKSTIPEHRHDINKDSLEKLGKIIAYDEIELFLKIPMKGFLRRSNMVTINSSRVWLLYFEREQNNISASGKSPSTVVLKDFIKEISHYSVNPISESIVSGNENSINSKSIHLNFCKEKIKNFVGRHNQIRFIKELCLKDGISHIVIYGESGCGKTCMLSFITIHLPKWILAAENQPKKLGITARFIGISQDSYSIKSLLFSVIQELSIEYNLEIDMDRISIERIFDYFKQFLFEVANKNSDCMFFIILDSLDQLAKENDARKLAWLPTSLPSNMKIIVSTLMEDEFDSYRACCSMFFDSLKSFVHIENLSQEEVDEMVHLRLNILENNDLKKKIKGRLENSFVQSKHCLYVGLILDEALKWNSFTNLEKVKLQNTAVSAISKLLEKTEKIFNKEFVAEALRCITISRKGLAVQDLLAILSTKFEDTYFTLMHLISYLRQYLLGPLYRWCHRKFIEVAQKRYCDDDEKCQKTHRLIVDLFKSNEYSNKNSFWISELPYHAVNSHDLNLVKDNFLLNIKFLRLKVEVINIDELINDYDLAVKTFKDIKYKHGCIKDIEAIQKTLVISSRMIYSNPNHITSQIFSRIPDEYVELGPFLNDCLSLPENVIMPNKKYLTMAINESQENIILHNKRVLYLTLTHNKNYLIINTFDKMIKVYITNSFEAEISKFDRTFFNTQKLLISNDDRIIYAIGIERLKNHDDYEKLGILEAFDIMNRKRLFQIDSLNNEQVKYFGFMVADSYLRTITKNNCFKLNLEGKIIDHEKLPCDWDDRYIHVQFQGDLMVASCNIMSKILVIGRNGKLVYHDFGDYYVRGGFLFLANSNVVLSMRKDIQTKFNDITSIWLLMELNVDTLEIVNTVRINKSLYFFGSSTDSNIVYGSCYSYIYGLDLENKVTLFALEHNCYLGINDFNWIFDKTIISSSKGNHICLYNIEKNNIYEDHDVFNAYNSRELKFILDDFSPRCPIVLMYNMFLNHQHEMFLLYDLKNEKILRKFNLVNFELGDLNPLCLVDERAFLVESFKHKAYAFISLININQSKIFKEVKKAKLSVFKRITKNRFVIAEKLNDQEDILRLFEFKNDDEFIIENLCDWNDIEWFVINENKIIFKRKNNKLLTTIRFDSTNLKDESEFCYQQESYDEDVLLSSDGKYIVFYKRKSEECVPSNIKIFNVEQKLFEYRIPILSRIDRIYFTDCLLIIQLHDNQERCTYIYALNLEIIDLKNIDLKNFLCFTEKELINFNKFPNLNTFNFLKHKNSSYFWMQSHIYTRDNFAHSSLAVFHVNDVSKAVFNVDTEVKLRVNQISLICDGNHLLVKEYEKISFVIFTLKLNNGCTKNPQNEIFDAPKMLTNNEDERLMNELS